MFSPQNTATKNKKFGLCFLARTYEANSSTHPQSDLRAIGGFFFMGVMGEGRNNGHSAYQTEVCPTKQTVFIAMTPSKVGSPQLSRASRINFLGAFLFQGVRKHYSKGYFNSDKT